MKEPIVSIIGGGIAGLTAAIALEKAGITAQVYESSEQLLPVGAGLGLAANAMKAFQALGLYQEVVQAGNFLSGFSIHSEKGTRLTGTTFEPSAKNAHFTIHRAALHKLLLKHIAPEIIHLGKRLKTIEKKEAGLALVFQDDSWHYTDFLIVADGIHSAVRQLVVPGSQPRYAGYTCWRAVIDNSELQITASSETWGPKGCFGLVPLADNKLYWFACINAPEGDPVYKAYGTDDLLQQFNSYHDPIKAVLRSTEDKQLIHTDILDLDPVPRFAFDKLVLIGDAAHATVPNMGQGACQAIEDAVVLAECIMCETDMNQAFRKFEKRRMERTHWVVTTSRKIGKMAQLENRLMIGWRNTLMRLLPDSMGARQLKKLEDIEFYLR